MRHEIGKRRFGARAVVLNNFGCRERADARALLQWEISRKAEEDARSEKISGACRIDQLFNGCGGRGLNRTVVGDHAAVCRTRHEGERLFR